MSHRDATGFGGAADDGDDDDRAEGPRGDDDLGRQRGGLPHPLDRLWMHPSELAAFAAPTPRARTRPMWTATLVAGAAGAILTLGVLGAVGALDRPAEHIGTGPVVPTSAPMPTDEALALAAAHSVVAVSVHDERGTRRGSGVCVRRSGEILTSDRLVGNAKKIDVTTSDGQERSARVIGRDATTDLVLLRVVSDGSKVNAMTASFGTEARIAATAPKTGDSVFVVGAPSPGDSEPWLSNGLVASTDSLVAVDRGPTTSGLLETAAASSTASSGGALVDRDGKVTGIVLAPISGSRMTYAVPIAIALTVANDLRAHGYTKHGALGIDGINAPDGPTVTSMDTEGPADVAGVRVGDVVESVDRRDVYTMSQLMALVRHDRPGQIVELALRRGSTKLKMLATLASTVTP
jgi:putative serine protease PepD